MSNTKRRHPGDGMETISNLSKKTYSKKAAQMDCFFYGKGGYQYSTTSMLSKRSFFWASSCTALSLAAEQTEIHCWT